MAQTQKLQIGDRVEAYPMLIGGEIIPTFGATISGKIVAIMQPGWQANIYSKHTTYIIEKDDGTRRAISERQIR